MGHIVLQGGAEFQGQMRLVDQAALALAGGLDSRVGIVSAAAVPDDNQSRAYANAKRWFEQLGIARVQDLRLWDAAAANDPRILKNLESVGLLFILGGFPGYLARTLAGSAAWQVMVARLQDDPQWVLAGSSAGAMVLCDTFYDPQEDRLITGLGLLPGLCVIPHAGKFKDIWATKLASADTSLIFVCIDEQTGVITDARRHRWQVYGSGRVEIRSTGKTQVYRAGDTIQLP